MRRLSINVKGDANGGVYRVVREPELAGQWQPDLRFLVVATDSETEQRITKLKSAGLTNVVQADAKGLEPDDVIAYDPVQRKATVLYRASDVHHSLFLTNRCNSYCLMCSQPPTPQEDGWLIEQALEVVRHIKDPPPVIGVSGGEPLLVAEGLKRVLDAITQLWPNTLIEILTNGRLMSDAAVEELLFSEPVKNTCWLVPLYGHADFLHDFVVQSPGAFDETLDGLLTLQAHRQPIQLRVVLIQPVIDVLDELCRFIGQNLPFVECVALMACEPTGFALANRQLCELDLVDALPMLQRAASLLERYQIPHLFMNMPLCALPPRLWHKARKSISDWKNVYADECSECAVRERCCGLFAWHERHWKPTRLVPIKEAAL
jgi:His-Xaa-Ser system radical SAM maturase HxsC